MGLPLPHGKLAIWMFLVTEIMFFTALIGVYLILRNGTPSKSPFHWPAPHRRCISSSGSAPSTPLC